MNCDLFVWKRVKKGKICHKCVIYPIAELLIAIEWGEGEEKGKRDIISVH